MIKAYKIVRENFEAELTIIGGFYDASLEQWAKNYDSKYNLMINWKGWINYTKLAPHFSEADIGLCILQDSERYMKAIATKVYEYIIMGLPVVTSKGHMSDRLVKKEKYGISVDSSDENAIAGGILTLLNQCTNKGINKEKIQSLVQPDVNFKDSYNFSLAFYLKPEIKLDELKTSEIEKVISEVTKKDIDDFREKVRTKRFYIILHRSKFKFVKICTNLFYFATFHLLHFVEFSRLLNHYSFFLKLKCK